MRIGIDLLWVKPGMSGGTESYTRNLLYGFGELDKENEYVLFVAKDNVDSFTDYKKYDNMQQVVCNVKCYSPLKRYFWENLHMDNYARKAKVDVMFIPVYSKPFTYGSGIPYVTAIADLQAMHYPQYFSKIMYLYMRFIWKYTCSTADCITAISEDCKNDIEKYYPVAKGKVETVYLPVISSDSNMDFAEISEKYGIKDNDFYYCVSSMLPHKNLETMLKVISSMKKNGDIRKLVISGVGGRVEEFDQWIEKYDIADCVIKTGFVSNEERDCLYEHCKLFLFPSIFEGFGMPPIEAMRRGKKVVTTHTSCIYEVTRGKAVYVEKPYDVDEWVAKIKDAEKETGVVVPFEEYELESITRTYLDVITKCGLKNKKNR